MICTGNQQTPLYFANGNGGQYIWIVPILDLVIVTTAGAYNDARGDRAISQVGETVITDLRSATPAR